MNRCILLVRTGYEYLKRCESAARPLLLAVSQRAQYSVQMSQLQPFNEIAVASTLGRSRHPSSMEGSRLTDETCQVTPVRIVLQYREQPFQSTKVIVQAFFEWRGVQLPADYYTHICCNPPSSKLYIVVDLYHKTCPDVDLRTLKLEIFKVKCSGNNALWVSSTSLTELY